MQEYKENYEFIKSIYPYSLDHNDAVLRDINTIDIIPKSVYCENEEYYEDLIIDINKCTNRMEKIRLIDKLKEEFVSIPYYEYKKMVLFKKIKVLNSLDVNVLECDYSTERGFNTIKTDDIATFW